MDDYQNTIVKNLSGVDSSIQKLLLIQIIAIFLYGLLFFDGLAIKRETDALNRQLESTNELLSRFAWLDSLSNVYKSHPGLSQRYQVYLEQFQNRLLQLQRLRHSTYYGDLAENAFILDYHDWRKVRSPNIISHVNSLARRGRKIINQQQELTQHLYRSPPIDSLNQAIKIRKHLEPLPALFDTLGPLVDKVFPEDDGSYKKFCFLLDSLGILTRPIKLPSISALETAVNDVSLFCQSQDIDSCNLGGLHDFRKALTDSIHTKENQKGKIRFVFIEQPVSVKLVFYVALPVLIFLNHLLLLLFRKKGHLHRELTKSISSKHGKSESQISDDFNLSIYLSPAFLNFLFTRDTSIFLRIITWVFFFLLEITVGVLGLVVFWYLLMFLPTAESKSLITLILTGILLLIHAVQIIFIYIRVAKIRA